jgi:hypothetical protein
MPANSVYLPLAVGISAARICARATSRTSQLGSCRSGDENMDSMLDSSACSKTKCAVARGLQSVAAHSSSACAAALAAMQQSPLLLPGQSSIGSEPHRKGLHHRRRRCRRQRWAEHKRLGPTMQLISDKHASAAHRLGQRACCQGGTCAPLTGLTTTTSSWCCLA